MAETLVEYLEARLGAADQQAERHLLLAHAGGLLASVSLSTAIIGGGEGPGALVVTMLLFFVGLICAGVLPYLRTNSMWAEAQKWIEEDDSVVDDLDRRDRDIGTNRLILRLRALDGNEASMMVRCKQASAICFISGGLLGIGTIACI